MPERARGRVGAVLRLSAAPPTAACAAPQPPNPNPLTSDRCWNPTSEEWFLRMPVDSCALPVESREKRCAARLGVASCVASTWFALCLMRPHSLPIDCDATLKASWLAEASPVKEVVLSRMVFRSALRTRASTNSMVKHRESIYIMKDIACPRSTMRIGVKDVCTEYE